MPKILKENAAQKEAIQTDKGPVIIVSCPGSGKTTTLIRRIRHLIESGIAPETILMVTFAKAAADDMAMRYEEMYGENAGVTFATIHKFCYLVLLREGVVSRDSLLSEKEKREIIYKRLLGYADIDDIQEMITSVITELSVVKNNYIDIASYMPKSCEKKAFRSVYAGYEKEKNALGKIDFDDMLLRCLALFKEDEGVLEKYRKRFKYIQCDEYQDTNCIQRDILYLLAGREANLCVVGDDDQSIYRFRGANSSIMMNFIDDFRGLSPKKITMDRNYRSAQSIIDIASALIEGNRVRFEKKFISNRGELDGEKGVVRHMTYRSKGDEVEGVIKEVKRLHDGGMAYKDMAILFRNNRQAALPAQVLSREKIPFGSSDRIKTLYDDWIFEDIQAYINLSMGRDVRKNFFRVLNKPNRYLKATAFFDNNTDTGLVEYSLPAMLGALSYLNGQEEWRVEAAKNSIFNWMTSFGPGKITKDTPVSVLFARLSGKDSIGYTKHIKQSAKFRNLDEKEALEDFKELKKDALKYKTVGKWLVHAEKVSRTIKEGASSDEADSVSLSTIHRAKGQEWKAVFIIGATDGVLPSRNAITPEDIEEERRVLYVGLTRAKDVLWISHSGEESRFMKQARLSLKEKKEPVVKKKLAGAPVMHTKFGRGKIQGYAGDKVGIRFDSGELKKFKFPDVFADGIVSYV